MRGCSRLVGSQSEDDGRVPGAQSEIAVPPASAERWSASSARACATASVASEHERHPARDRVAQVLELEAVGVERVELDALDPAVSAELDHRLAAVPWVVEEERSLGPDRLELVALRKGGAAVEERD